MPSRKPKRRKELLTLLVHPPLEPGMQKLLRIPLERTLEQEGKRGGWLSLAFVSSQVIRELNGRYRGKDRATDILSFPPPPGFKTYKGYWGELVLSPRYILEFAEQKGLDPASWGCRILVHGMLHLLGYDHHTPSALNTMQGKEEGVLETLPTPTQRRILALLERLAQELEKGQGKHAKTAPVASR